MRERKIKMDLIHIPTGTPIYRIDDGAGYALLLLAPEAFKRTPRPTFNVQEKTNNPAAPRWCVQKNPWGDHMEICLSVLNTITRYPGPNQKNNPTTEQARAMFKAQTGQEVPAHILEEFSLTLKSSAGLDAEQSFESRLEAKNKQYAREQKERTAQNIVELLG
jgi:hypothetical protein